MKYKLKNNMLMNIKKVVEVLKFTKLVKQKAIYYNLIETY